MRRAISYFVIFLLFAVFPLSAQLSPEQRVIDFQTLAALFVKKYAFLEWKKEALQFDALDLAPWIERVRNAKDDLEFFEISAEYVARFQDSHTAFFVPSEFSARLGVSVDFYDGKLMVDNVDRVLRGDPAFPLKDGDEIVAFEGKTIDEALAPFLKIAGEGNPATARRQAATYLVNRPQFLIPRAHEVPEKATIMIHRQDGSTDTVQVPWIKEGRPYLFAGPVPTPLFAAQPADTGSEEDLQEKKPERQRWPRFMDSARKRQQFAISPKKFARGVGVLAPQFELPEGFVQRLGLGRFDDFFTGTFEAEGMKIGYLRLPQFFFFEEDLETEIRYFEENTQGLIIDITRNPGGYGCDAETLARYLHPEGFRSLGVALRPTWYDILDAQFYLDLAKEFGGTPEEIAELEKVLKAMEDAFAKSRGMTEPLPLCGSSLDIQPRTGQDGKPIAYSKPVVVATDEFSYSAAELFAAIMQDSGRAMIFGARTAGAGGASSGATAGVYSETEAALAIAIAIRREPVGTLEYPAAPYIENIGVRPSKTAELMTVENLMNRGATYRSQLISATLEYIRSKQAQ